MMPKIMKFVKKLQYFKPRYIATYKIGLATIGKVLIIIALCLLDLNCGCLLQNHPNVAKENACWWRRQRSHFTYSCSYRFLILKSIRCFYAFALRAPRNNTEYGIYTF